MLSGYHDFGDHDTSINDIWEDLDNRICLMFDYYQIESFYYIRVHNAIISYKLDDLGNFNDLI